jgi:hypothetical protein
MWRREGGARAEFGLGGGGVEFAQGVGPVSVVVGGAGIAAGVVVEFGEREIDERHFVERSKRFKKRARSKASEQAEKRAGAEVDEGGGLGESAEEMTFEIKNAEGGGRCEREVEFAGIGVKGEGVECDGAVEGNAGDAGAVEGVGGDAGEVAAAEDEELVAGGIVGDAGGRGVEGGEGDRADERTEAVGLDECGEGRMREKNMAVAWANGEIAADGGGEFSDGVSALNGAGGAIDDAYEVTRCEAQEEVIGERIVGEASEGFAGREEGGDRDGLSVA